MKRSYDENVRLLTGIPRSGTTLCCRLLNQVPNLIALHEPIDPLNLKSTEHDEATQEIRERILEIQRKTSLGLPIPHGTNSGLIIENPISDETHPSKMIRPLTAQRGEIVMSKPSADFQLVVKQNALFTALSGYLSKHFSMVAIVRNPIDVIASWMTVDLPVNKGRIPGGEKFDLVLAKNLNSIEGTLLRQKAIYTWFSQKIVLSGIPVIKYEDIIATNGQTLFKAFGFSHFTENDLTQPQRILSQTVINRLNEINAHWVDSDSSGLYSSHEIRRAYQNLHY